jgi:hypothetical protein
LSVPLAKASANDSAILGGKLLSLSSTESAAASAHELHTDRQCDDQQDLALIGGVVPPSSPPAAIRWGSPIRTGADCEGGLPRAWLRYLYIEHIGLLYLRPSLRANDLIHPSLRSQQSGTTPTWPVAKAILLF